MDDVMQERADRVGVVWKDEGDGYFSGFGLGPMGIQLGYIALPDGHPAIHMDYDSLSPDVNGGLTWGKGRVFGWDYGHAYNYSNLSHDIPAALEYFRNYEEET